MRFLLDQHLSPRLKQALLERYPGTVHVRGVGLQSANKQSIWLYAAQNGFTIAFKNADFQQRSFLFGLRWRVGWIRMRNCSTSEIEPMLEAQHDTILAFEQTQDASFLASG